MQFAADAAGDSGAAGVRLAGRIALVTGAGRNIGRAIATTFAAEGANLVIATGSDRASLEQTAAACCEHGVEVEQVVGDVASPDETAAMVRLGLERFGRIDVLASTVAI